jgi:hypothetical protein
VLPSAVLVDEHLRIRGVAVLLGSFNHSKELLPRRRIIAETAKHSTCYEVGAGFVHASCRHAVMGCLDDHTDSVWLEYLVDHVGDLRCQSFLNL